MYNYYYLFAQFVTCINNSVINIAFYNLNIHNS